MLRVRVRQPGQKEKKIDLSTGVHVKPEQWLADKQSLSTKVRSAAAYNERLRRHHLEILTFCEKALAAGQDPINELKKLKKQTPEVKIGLIEFAEEYLKSKKDISAQTKINYRSLLKNLRAFVEKKKINAILKDINERFLKDFFWFMIEDLKMGNLTAETKATQLGVILNEAAHLGHIQPINHKKIKIKLKKTNVDVALTEIELDKVMQYEPIKHFDVWVKDIFLIMCFTGVRYSDYIRLSTENIKIDEASGQKYVNILMQKTGKFVTFPLNNYALSILEKYSYKLPKYSSVLFNKRIKIIGKEAGINGREVFTVYKGTKRIEEAFERYELLSSHVGRRTWATLSYKKGIPLEAISKCLGHASISQTEEYLRLKETDFNKDVSGFWNDEIKRKE